jgi:hypothetical protein
MSHHHYSDGQVGEEREFYGASETSEGEREYYEHVRAPRASMLNSAITVGAIVLVLSAAFGFRASTTPTQQVESPVVYNALITPAADSCSDLSPYGNKEC